MTTADTTVVFRNFTGLEATVTLTLAPRVPRVVFTVPPGGTEGFPIPAIAVGGVYPYRVEVGSFHAVGGSDPRIIID